MPWKETTKKKSGKGLGVHQLMAYVYREWERIFVVTSLPNFAQTYRNYVFRCLPFSSSVRLYHQWVSQKLCKYRTYTIGFMLKFYRIIWERPSIGTKGSSGARVLLPEGGMGWEAVWQRQHSSASAQGLLALSESSALLEEHQVSSASQKLMCKLRGRIQALYPLKTGRDTIASIPVSVFSFSWDWCSGNEEAFDSWWRSAWTPGHTII